MNEKSETSLDSMRAQIMNDFKYDDRIKIVVLYNLYICICTLQVYIHMQHATLYCKVGS